MLFALFGAAALYIGADYSMGSAQRPGTGVLPHILSWCLVVTGLVLILQGVLAESKVVRSALPTIVISALASAVLFFGGPAIGISEGWAALPIIIGCLVMMEVLLPGTAWRPLAAVSLATVVFGIVLDDLGLVITMILTLTICAAGTPETRWREYFLFLALMLVLGVGTFIVLLGMPIPTWPVRVPNWLFFLQR
jgi:putative tricarboxylic transport membrane protein